MSLKGKIALLNTILMSSIVILLLFFMISISDTVVDTSSKNQLKYILEENAEEIEWDDGKLDLDDVDFYVNHVSILIYTADGIHIAGNISDQTYFEQFPLINTTFTPVTFNGIDYLLYDILVESRKHSNIYVRGIVSITEMSETVSLLFHLTLFFLPFFILFAGFASYIVTKKTMKPLEKIVETAQDISHGDDLSQRINLGKGKDEIYQLATTFDTMFSQLELAFLTEKQFSSDVSHELRTPTAVILAECECNLTKSSSTEEKTEALEVIQKQALKMQNLISALLNFVRLDNGLHKLEKEEVDFSELITLVCQEQECLLTKKQKIFTEIPENISFSMDYGLMIRVLSNLINNGFQYGSDESWVKVSLFEEREKIVILVEDNGIGIPEDKLDMIFHRFYQVDPSRSKENMGLGLSMVSQIVKLHGGTITATSKLGEGSCFTLTFQKT